MDKLEYLKVRAEITNCRNIAKRAEPSISKALLERANLLEKEIDFKQAEVERMLDGVVKFEITLDHLEFVKKLLDPNHPPDNIKRNRHGIPIDNNGSPLGVFYVARKQFLEKYPGFDLKRAIMKLGRITTLYEIILSKTPEEAESLLPFEVLLDLN